MKKLLVIVLVLTLVLGVGVNALATDAQCDAVIEWTTMSADLDGVFDPGDLPSEIEDMTIAGAIPNYEALESMELDFGSRFVSLLDETYYSWDDQDDTDPLPVDLWNRAGALIISSLDDWEVIVEIDEFIIQGGLNSGDATMLGFELTLIPNDEEMGGTGSGGPDGDVNVTGGTFTPATIAISEGCGGAMIATGDMGIFGANWEGELEVLGGTAVNSLGEQARAVMDWNFIPGS